MALSAPLSWIPASSGGSVEDFSTSHSHLVNRLTAVIRQVTEGQGAGTMKTSLLTGGDGCGAGQEASHSLKPTRGLSGWPLDGSCGGVGSKVLAKKELAYVPIIGWMWYFTEMVFCTRKWEQDRKTVSESLLHLRDYPEKYFFLIHCEGTRFTEKKHQISMQVAQAKGLPSLKHHLLPRTKGFAITVRSLRNVVSAVYDCTLNFRNNENPTLLGVLNGKKYHADLYVRRIPLGEVPEDEDRCAAWLHKLYQEKQRLLPDAGQFRPRLLPSVGVRWMIGVTEIDKGSAYGNMDSKQKHSD
eukprot:bmy_15057T0